MKDRADFYTKLKAQLEDTTKFPADYLYKFIVPTDENQVEEVKNLFNKGGAIIDTKMSKKGNYVSVSVRLKVKSAVEVIEYYQNAEVIKGIISL